MPYVIEVNRRDMSDYLEHCAWKDEEGHNAEGTGPDCDEMCKSTDGDPREIKEHGTKEHEYDEDAAEEYGSPYNWACFLLSGHHFPDLHNGGTANGGKRPERDWLSGNEGHAYRDEYTEWSVYLRGDWTEEERFRIFEEVAA